MEIGFVHPPIGINLYVMHSIAPDIPIGRVFKGVLPFLAADFLHLAMLIAIPAWRWRCHDGWAESMRTFRMPSRKGLHGLRQDSQQVARDAVRAGARVVGYVGNDIPIALIIAAGALPVRVHGWPQRATPRPTASSRARSRPSCVSSWKSG
jgi:hypothetical protein